MASPAVSVSGLTKNYGTSRAVRGSISIQAGEVFGLLGPNGAGRTTTVEITGDVGHALLKCGQWSREVPRAAVARTWSCVIAF
jgi:ABC-type branched-subunit amino acid transport system ATPase component